MRRWVLLLGLLPGLPAAAAVLGVIADDFESGQLLQADGGHWSDLELQANNQFFVTAAAAHRGDAGARLVDTDAVATPGSDGSLAFDLPFAITAPYFERMWVRVTPTVALGNFDVIQNFADGGVTTFYPLAARVHLPDGGLALVAENAGGTYTALNAQVPAADGQWHLLEIAMMGLDTGSGVRLGWFDGHLIANGAVDWTGLSLTTFKIGEPHCEGTRAFMGTIDFDDVRSSIAPPATFLNVVVPDGGPLVVGQCTAASAQLLDEDGQLAPAPYDVAFAFSFPGGGVPLAAFGDSLCATALAGFIPAPQSTQSIWIKAAAAGTAYPEAVQVDFLNLPTAYAVIGIDAGSVSDSGVVDSGVVDSGVVDSGVVDSGVVDSGVVDSGTVDGGGSDSGTVDAGAGDAGQVDAGTFDSGARDAGPDASANFGVGCGCTQTTEAAWLPLGALALWLARRRRGARP